MIRQSLFALTIATLLAACGSQAAPPAPTAVPTAAVVQPTSIPATAVPPAPTAQPTLAPTTQPTLAPTAAPAPTTPPAALAALPAPIYALVKGQVVRLDPDGKTSTILTSETPFNPDALAIVELAVSPSNNSLAYILQGDGSNSLITTDAQGQNRRVLLENAPVSAPRWSADGSALAVQMSAIGAGRPRWPAGVWVVSAVSGEARQLLANDPQPSDGVSESWGYAPEAWSPDGKKLLVARYSQVAEACDAAILEVDSGALRVLQSPEDETPRLQIQCAGGVWAADSSAVYVTQRGPGISPPTPGLLRADAASGMLTYAVPETTYQTQFMLVQSYAVSARGELYALVALADRVPDPATDPNMVPPAAQLYRVAPGGKLELLRPEMFVLATTPIWAPGAVGAVLHALQSDGSIVVNYVPLSGAVQPLALESATTITWGR